MGNCGSAQVHSDERTQNQRIEEEIKKDRQALRTEAKMLLLGAGESGKSTMLKQIRLAYREPLTSEERVNYRPIVFSNLVQSMAAVISAFESEGIELNIPGHLMRQANFICSLDVESFGETSMLDPGITRAVTDLWQDRSTQEVVEQASRFQLNDSAQYFFDEVRRIGSEAYIPTDQDILHTRVRTTGITEERFRVKGYLLRVFDVGGQRSERKKWIHCFEGVSVVVFVAAINEYDQQLWEDESVNRLDEAIQLFESLATSRWFDRSSFVLLLNKTDLFRRKLITSPLAHHFPDYHGGVDFALATNYMVKKFTKFYPTKGRRQLFMHATCATDTTQARVVISAMLDSVISATLAEVGLM